MKDTELSRLIRNARNSLAIKWGVPKVGLEGVDGRLGEKLGYSEDTVRNWMRPTNPKRPSVEALCALIKLFLQEGVIDRNTALRMMKELPESMRAELLPLLPSASTRDRIIIFYIPSDQPLADLIARRLSADFHVSFETHQSRERFLDELKKADGAIGLYTSAAAHDEFFNTLLEDVQLQYRNGQLLKAVLVHDGLTAKVDFYRDEGFQTVYWPRVQDQQPQALKRLDQISRGEEVPKESITGPVTVPVGPLERDDLGAVPIPSPYYIQRDTDQRALNMVDSPGGCTMVIKGPRQVGKTSLLWRVAEAARQAGKRVVEVSFQELRPAMDDLDHLLYALCAEILIKLQLEDKLSESWAKHKDLTPGPRCKEYLLEYVLKADTRPLVLAIDEVDAVFDKDFRSEFFSMLRSWVNESRSSAERGRLMHQLELALVTSTDSHRFITDTQSPFNIIDPIVLRDFTYKQTADLNQRHGSPLPSSQLDELFALINGHPYLSRRALYLIAAGAITFSDLMETADDSLTGPFSSHLETLWYRLPKQPEVLNSLKEIFRKGKCSDENVLARLVGAGLVIVTGRERKVQARCKLYETFLKERLRK